MKQLTITMVLTLLISILPLSFRTEASEVSYLRDTTKNYTYRYYGDNNEWETLTYNGIYKGKDNVKKGYEVWNLNNSSGYKGQVLEKETKEGLYSSDVYNTGDLLVSYPLKVGTSWTMKGGKWTVKSLSRTVKTPAGTFKNVIEVEGVYEEVIFNNFYANGVGLIRQDSDGNVMMELKELRKKNSAEVKTAFVDVSSGRLSVRSGAGNKYKIVGSLKNNAKVTVYSQTKNGWSEIIYNNKKAYISNQYLRFYTKMSAINAKKIVDRINKIEQEAVKGEFTKNQLYARMSQGYTTSFIDGYFKTDVMEYRKDKYGNKTYEYRASDFNYYTMHYIWTKSSYTKPPTITYYDKNGKQYLIISQYWYRDEIRNAYTGKLYLMKENSKSNWKVYKFNRR
ncbi:SH3 domain-containing protein [Peribacillus sp. SCS-155]|uniref:SH3 domain-containing protein n=1 Tax=Peribacillus sedimenti TaxID=3115297 RepID=UPI0039062831